MDLYELRIFLHVCRTLNLGKTGEECHISPSALSRLIQRLEDEAGDRLFTRGRRILGLSASGRKFRSFAQDVVDRWDGLKNEIQGEDLQGEISLYCSVTACYGILPDIIERFRARFPRVGLNLQTGSAADAIAAVKNYTADFSIAALPDLLPDDLLFKNLTNTPLVFIAAAEGGLSQFPVSADLAVIPMILPDHGIARERVDQWFRDKGVKASVYAQVAGNEAIIAMVSLGCGVGVVPALVAENSPMRTKIKILDWRPGLRPYTVGLCARKSALDTKLNAAFWDNVD